MKINFQLRQRGEREKEEGDAHLAKHKRWKREGDLERVGWRETGGEGDRSRKVKRKSMKYFSVVHSLRPPIPFFLFSLSPLPPPLPLPSPPYLSPSVPCPLSPNHFFFPFCCRRFFKVVFAYSEYLNFFFPPFFQPFFC